LTTEIDYDKIREIVKEVLSEELLLKGTEIELGDKWRGGELILKPREKNLKPKHIPIEIFFHKIVMMRDRLRVLEQKINSSKNLTDEEKIDIQQYITRIYGSMTTFNLLFKRKSSYFVGERKSQD